MIILYCLCMYLYDDDDDVLIYRFCHSHFVSFLLMLLQSFCKMLNADLPVRYETKTERTLQHTVASDACCTCGL